MKTEVKKKIQTILSLAKTPVEKSDNNIIAQKDGLLKAIRTKEEAIAFMAELDAVIRTALPK